MCMCMSTQADKTPKVLLLLEGKEAELPDWYALTLALALALTLTQTLALALTLTQTPGAVVGKWCSRNLPRNPRVYGQKTLCGSLLLNPLP